MLETHISKHVYVLTKHIHMLTKAIYNLQKTHDSTQVRSG